jgi:SAM-dependent methyltransferase
MMIDNDRITISSVHMTKKYDINELDIICDIRDDDVSYQFEDQLRIIENIYHYLKPGGRLIIEDIDNSYENNYSVLLDKFKHCYFIKLDDNTKLVILIKNEYSLFY